MDAPSSNDLSWLLYYLARSHIQVKQADLKERMENLLSDIVDSKRPGDPADILHYLFRLKLTAHDLNTLGR